MIMKRIIAMLAAAMLIVAAAGCANKSSEPDSSTVASSSAEETATVEESSAEIAEESTTAGKAVETSVQAVTDSGIKPTQGTTREPLNSVLPTVKNSTTAVNKPLTTQPATRQPATSKPAATTTATTKPITTKPTATKPSTTNSSTIPAAPTTKVPMTTAASYTPPVIEYGGTLGTAEDSIRIASHEVSLSTNNTFAIKLDVDILACSGTVKSIFIAYDCYDADGNKLNEKPVKTIVPVRQDKTKTIAIASAPFETAKVVFSNV